MWDKHEFVWEYEEEEKKPLHRCVGKRLRIFPESYVVIDTETTGLDPSKDELIEVAALKICNGEISGSFQSLLRPSQEVSGFVTQLTGITNEMLTGAPCAEEIWNDFLEFVGDDIIIGHNIRFDINFIYDYSVKYQGIPFGNDFVDTLYISRQYIHDVPNHQLSTLADYFHFSAVNAHRALANCEVANQIYLALKNISSEISDVRQDSEPFHVDKRENSAKSFSKQRIYSNRIDIKQLVTSKTEFDETHPLYGKNCVFTGTLKKMERRDAMQAVLDSGGTLGSAVTKRTKYLILGNNEDCPSVKNGKSSKQKRAEELKLAGQDIEIISEDVFYKMIGLM